VRVGILYSRIRTDEKRLLGELRERDHDVVKVDVRDHQFGLGGSDAGLAACDLVVDRCLATSRSVHLTSFLESYGIPVVNSHATAATCADKAETSLALADAGVPTPATTVAFTEASALDAAADLGYPCVVKPVVGSWGRLVAKLDDETAAESVFEHKATLGHYEHSVFYVQEYVEKPGRDLRVLAADGEPVAAMARESDHWRTNAADGAAATGLAVDEDLAELVAAASEAVGGGLLGVDAMERPNGSYVVHEVNHTPEFTALDGASDVNVPAAVADWLESKAAPESEVVA
jgi:[lysine-biosynthesis-protein LysW]--L-2-aminoadipate ligase